MNCSRLGSHKRCHLALIYTMTTQVPDPMTGRVPFGFQSSMKRPIFLRSRFRSYYTHRYYSVYTNFNK